MKFDLHFKKKIFTDSTLNHSNMEVKDSNGNLLNDGDSVMVTKDLKVKGTSGTLKRGTKVKGIRLTEDVDAVECRIGKSTIVLKTCFLKKY